MIDYRLDPRDIIQFPFVSPYGLRHLDKHDFLNKVIGVIELFPVLGPLVSIIEGVIANTINEIQNNFRLQKQGLVNKLIGVIEVIPVIGSLVYRIDRLIELKTFNRESNLTVEDTAKWMKEFKENVLSKKPFEQVDLSLTEDQCNEVVEVIQDFDNFRNNFKSKKGKLYASQVDYVFTVHSIPGRIFKVPNNRHNTDNSGLKKRMESASKAKEVIKKEKLDLLHVPEQKLSEIQIDGKTVPVLIEESFDILHGTNHQEGLFQNAYADPELKEFMRECTRQLIIFIIRTGYADFRYDNNPLLTNGRGIGLIDLDTSNSPITGLRRGCSTGQDGILQYLSVEEIEHFEPLLQKELSEEHYKALDLDKLKLRLIKWEKKNPKFKQYLANKRITTGREYIDVTGWNPFASDTLSKLEWEMNDQAANRLGFNLLTDRIFYTKDHFSSETLNALKAAGRIFKWRSFKEVNSSSCGFLIWA